MCVISQDAPKSLTDAQKSILKQLARQVLCLLELRKQNFELKHYQEQLATYSIQMEEFAYTAAHDLRAPLRAITSFLQLIEMKRGGDLDAKEQQYFDFIHTNVKTMNQLILDLLDYAKSDSKIEEQEEVDLNLFVKQIFNNLVEHHHLTQSDLVLDFLPTILCSKLALHLIFYNLIDNSLKYRKKEGSLELKITYESDLLSHSFKFEDNGIGISSEFYEQIFKPFQRLHTKSAYPGSGLGLATVKKIVQKLGGTIVVASELGKGSVFEVQLPKN